MKSENELRELDAFCAEFVMKWNRTESRLSETTTNETLFWHRKEPEELESVLKSLAYEMKFERGSLFSHSWERFQPTTDPAAAMLVLEKCAEKLLAREVNESVGIVGSSQSGWIVFTFRSNGIILRAEAETLPLAICLLAKEIFK